VVVLVEPAGPLNVGAVARLCANFGVHALRLVAPRCDPLGEEALRMAVHAAPLLERAQRFPHLAAALADCGPVVACSGRRAGEPSPLLGPDQALTWLLTCGETAPVALVFGREDRGLSNDELLQAGRLLCIETDADTGYGSLNLSHAVAIVLQRWQCLRATAGEASPPPQAAPCHPCPRGQLEAMLADAEALLLEVGFLYPHTANARMARVRSILQRAEAAEPEVALLRGMVRQLRWASGRGEARSGQTP
jgi:tRNA/rRNA methyltransferase